MTSRPRLNELNDNLELVYTNGGEREGQMRMSMSHLLLTSISSLTFSLLMSSLNLAAKSKQDPEG